MRLESSPWTMTLDPHDYRLLRHGTVCGRCTWYSNWCTLTLMTYLLWMQVLAVATMSAEWSAGKPYRHRMDIMSARWQESESLLRGLSRSWLMRCVPFHRFGITSSAADGTSLPAEKRFGLGRYPFRVRMWYFFKRSPANCTLIARHPRLGFGFG
jgi:hypothetical protein